MTELPTGTISFLFTDVEDSTRIAQRLGIGFAALMSEHFELIRAVVDEHRGLEVKSTGDGVFAVFTSVGDAIRAAGAIQQAITHHSWPSGGEVKVRIGIHTGEATVFGEDYVGLDVHRASRVMSAGHGGQVLVTEATALLAGDDFELRDLGRHLLRGLESEERVHQVVFSGLPTEFPPLRTARAAPNNLPTRLAPIIGRGEDVTQLADLMMENRLVTILGPGGVGKTSLAISTASKLIDEFRGGVVFVDLSSIFDPDLLIPSIASAVGAESMTLDGIEGRIGDSPVLFILDNFEQIVSVASRVTSLLELTDCTKLLVTSQIPLRIQGERRYVLDPLDPEGFDGFNLFIDRARAVAPGFDPDHDEIREVVRFLGGLPLAIELVAARANILSPTQMLERLRQGRMAFGSSSDSPDRHKTLDSAIAWSYELLGEQGRRCFRKLGIFAGPMTLDAVEAVAGGDTIDPVEQLAELVDRSLVRRVPASGRFTMLDALRRYARRLLDASPDYEDTVAAYVAFYTNLCRDAYTGLQGDRGEWWRALLDGDIENLRAVLAVLHEQSRRDEGLGMLGNIWRFYQSRGRMVELDTWLERFFQLEFSGPEGAGTVKGLMARSAVLYWQRKPEEAVKGYRHAVDRAADLGDDHLRADALYGLATSLIVAGQIGDAPAPLGEAKDIYTQLGDESGIADVIAAEAFASLSEGGWDVAGPKFKEAGEIYERVGRLTQAAQSKFAQAGAALAGGDLDGARRFTVEAIHRGQRLNDVFLQVWGVEYVSRIELDLGNVEFAGLLAGAAAAAAEKAGGGWSPATIGLEDTSEKLIRRFGEEEAARLMEPGRAVGVEDAVARALSGR